MEAFFHPWALWFAKSLAKRSMPAFAFCAILLPLDVALAADALPAGRARPPSLATCDPGAWPSNNLTAKTGTADLSVDDSDDGDDDEADPGPSYFSYPGSDTCIAIGGELEFDAVTLSPARPLLPSYGSVVIPRFAIDTVTPTEYGVVRAFIRIDFTEFGRTNASSAALNYAFISLGDVTTGRAQAGFTDSTFTFYSNELNVFPLRGPGPSATMIRYSFLPLTGFGWAASLERDASNVRQAQLDSSSVLRLTPDTTAPPRLPLANASLVYTGDWGKMLVAGSIGQLQLNGPLAQTLPRFAALAGVELKLAGDRLWLQAAASSANVTYLGFGSAVLAGGTQAALADGVVSRAGPAKPTRGFALTAAYSHSLDEKWTLNAFGSLAAIKPATPSGVEPFIVPFKELRAGGNLVFSPSDEVGLTVEAQWVNLSTSASTSTVANVNAVRKSSNGLVLGFQALRNF